MNYCLLSYIVKLSLIILFILPASIQSQTNDEKPVINSIGMKMIKIESGSFVMGNPDPPIDCWDEQPLHKVTFSNSFYISELEVTIDQYLQFKPDFESAGLDDPFATGISWYDAVEFCKWLSAKEGKPYRLPTEAEWEFACRAGTDTPFWSGDQIPAADEANPWGVKNVHNEPREWCLDWYGPYPIDDQTDPVGVETSMAKVIRGGGLDLSSDHYARSFNRAGMAPAFSMLQSPELKAEEVPDNKVEIIHGLFGVYFGDPRMSRFSDTGELKELQNYWKKELRSPGNDWSAKWSGSIIAPASGLINFYGETDHTLKLTIDGKEIFTLVPGNTEGEGAIKLVEGKEYSVTVIYAHDGGEDFMKIEWSWPGQEKTPIPSESIYYVSETIKEIAKNYVDAETPGQHRIGFRIVQAPMPESKPMEENIPFVRQCVVQENEMVNQAPDPKKPWYKKRTLLPIPLDNEDDRQIIRDAGFQPGMMGHNHSPALEVCPNGDVLLIIYTSEHEYEPEVSQIAARLRFGNEEWDMPEILFDFPDVNDHAPMLWTENDTMRFYWGNPRFPSAYPFQWMTSNDNGATWSEVNFPHFVNEIGPHSRQPINTAFRSLDGIIYISSDAEGGTSVLWASSDNGKTWYDTEGRSAGRHTTYVELNDGSILGMGGKNTNIDGYMPKAISKDGGKTWEVSKTPFAALGSNQRPIILRLQSGRLFFAGDFQHRNGEHPEAITQRGSYVALSDDEGETWHIKKLVGALPHESDNRDATLGYSAARQAPNGVIHLITTMNTPCLHFEINEAWILSDSELIETENPAIEEVKKYETKFPSGEVKRTWSAGLDSHGRYLLNGIDKWYYENGQLQWEVNYNAGRKSGNEKFYSKDGKTVWAWIHKTDGSSEWTQYHSNGERKSVSTWLDSKCEGLVKRWDVNGKLISEKEFKLGKAVN